MTSVNSGEHPSQFWVKNMSKGIETEPEKVEAIREWEKPTDALTLKSFFGMLNFVVKFISNLSARTTSKFMYLIICWG